MIETNKDNRMTYLIRAALGALLAVGAASQAALAHAEKEGTRPADGAVLTAPPETLGMNFDMPMRVTLIALTDQDGNEHALTRHDGMQPVTAFDAVPPALPSGIYTVEWRGLADDGHPMQGRFSFEVTD
ncbi:copper resistance protein CopC [Sinirhodobacter sp. WL0062]|uniref:Copper resistance protein CopC n=1 Tax=Rhodobacter flavimaris TaxID=2907145 RepID=A0ABS8YX26_9RHOB|nr:copper resistance CopC family protein [Sinirhodobacter sp. WL0062]MCE5973113.1 copper resistance protein CopC [Sinirhodobacter sp. WL0062]